MNINYLYVSYIRLYIYVGMLVVKKGKLIGISFIALLYWNMVLRTPLNPLTPNDHYSGCTAPLTSKRVILYIYSTNIGTEYFKHGIYCPFCSLQNAVCFIILT